MSKQIKCLLVLMLSALVLVVAIGCGGSKIELSFDNATYTLEVGKDLPLAPTVSNPNNEEYELEYSSEHETVATYANGKVTGIAVGETKVKVSVKGNEKIYAEATIIVEEVVKHTVTFNTDGGTEIAAVEVENGAKLTLPAEPTKDGHVFEGWFTNAEKTIPFNVAVSITSNLTLYAKWELADYTVTFETNGGTEVNSREVKHGSKLPQVMNPFKENYTFVGWFVDEDLTEEFDFDTEIYEDMTLYAKWELVEYSVVFMVDNAEYETQMVKYGEAPTLPEEPTKEGFDFVGWFKDFNRTQEFDFEEDVVESDLILYAKWSLDEIDGYLVPNGGVLEGVVITPKEGAEPVEQELGFFNGDFTSANVSKGIFLYRGDHQLFAGDKTDTTGAIAGQDGAWWAFKLGLTEIAPNTLQVDAVVGFSNDTPIGIYDYILMGVWLATDMYPGFNFVNGGVQVGDILVIEGIDFDNDMGAVDGLIKKYKLVDMDYHYEITLKPDVELPTPTKRGYKFAGWYENNSYTGDPIYTVDENVGTNVLFAKWEQEEALEVIFDAGDYVDSEDTGLLSFVFYRYPGDKVYVPLFNINAEEGLEIVGWYTDEELTQEFDFNSPITESIRLYAMWDTATVKFVMELDGGVVEGSETYYTSELVGEMELGYFNSGYSWDNALTNLFLYDGDHSIFEGEGEEDTTYHGYKVGLKHVKGNLFLVEKVIGYGVETPKGVYDYVLAGIWRTADQPVFSFLQSLVEGQTLLIEGLDLEAEGGEIEANMKLFNDSEVNVYQRLVFDYNEELPTPVKEGFTFLGWYDNPEFEGEAVTEFTFEDKVASVYYAKWEAETPVEE